jgi:hypothetical protein
MSEPDDTVIAGTRTSNPKTCGDWRGFRKQLTSAAGVDPWQSAFQEYFLARVHLRYLAPIQLLQELDAKQGEGFAIVAIHCTLIEFLESTFQGKIYRYARRDSELQPHEYRKSKEMFCSFLRNRDPFSRTFDNDSFAESFYKGVRCALLHEARTKGGWKIWAGEPSGPVLDPKGSLIFHKGFQAALDHIIEWYRKALPSDSTLQEAFVRKFDSLCD